jgi:manganese/iron transport system permease protein
MNALLEPFGYEYMLNAMWVSAMVGGLCAFLSCYLMLKGWSLIGDALSHSIVPGVAGAYMLGLPFSLGAFLSGGLAAASMLFLNQRSRLKEDAIMFLTRRARLRIRTSCTTEIRGLKGSERRFLTCLSFSFYR